MNEMNKINEEAIAKLSNKINESSMNKKEEQENYFKHLKYLKDTCELNLRLILRKYYNDEELSEEDIEDIRGYIFLSKPNIFSHHANGPSFFELSVQAKTGAGNFSDEEEAILKKIHNEHKEKGKSLINTKKR